MKRTSRLFIAAAFATFGAALAACGSESHTNDSGGTADMSASPDMVVVQPLVGKWQSTGADIAPLLAGMPFNLTDIKAQFNADQTYTVDATDKNNTTTKFTGTWTATASTKMNIWDITLNQSMPSVVTSKGIYQVDTSVTPNRMTYEVAQTQPPISGVTPPTADMGFGSTSSGALGMNNVQKYSRLP